MPISTQKQLHQEGRFPYYRIGGRNKRRTGDPSDGSWWRPSMVPKMGSSLLLGHWQPQIWAFTPAYLASTGWDEGIYLIIWKNIVRWL